MFFKSLPEIDVTTLAEKLKSDEEFILLDVREADELLRAKISDRRLVHAALSQLSVRGISMLPAAAQGDALSSSKGLGKSVYVLCHHGNRSSQVTRWLVKQGWTNVFNVRGGIDAYARAVDRSVGMY